MITLLAVLAAVSLTTQAAKIVRAGQKETPAPPPPHCPGGDCVEKKHPGDDHDLELGACCFGHMCLGTGVPEHRCRGAWAGPDTGCDACERLRPCCDEATGECTNKFCSDCFFDGHKPVEYCEQCVKKPTPAPTHPPATKPPSPKPSPPTKPPTPDTKPGPPDGACCLPDGTCSEATQAECHHHLHGTFRGDYTWCEADTCKIQCCTSTLFSGCQIVDKPSDCDGHLGEFATECVDEEETCGVSCCLGAKCTVSKSSEHCEQCGGTPTPENDCSRDNFICGGACCTDDGCQFFGPGNAASLESQCAISTQGQEPLPVFNEGKTCDEAGVCGGACCNPATDEQDCIPAFGGKDECDSAGGVYQGEDTSCATASSRKRQNPQAAEVCLNDGACCTVDKQGQPQCSPAADSKQCLAMHGVWQGEGSDCTADEINCGAGACCDGKGCFSANSERECHWKGGKFSGPGTNCDMPAVCDAEGGACCCDSGCIDMADEKKCNAFGGISWQGVGSKCSDVDVCAPRDEGAGACCIQKSYIADGSLCKVTDSASQCEFLGGTFQGVDTECGAIDGDPHSFQCKEVRGACCVPGADKCYDNLLVSECRECGGHFAGEGVSCSDEYVCDPHHTGACCKAGWPCKETTHVMCLREGGRFQGFETTCNDEGGKVCAVCLPCEVERPDGNEQDCQHDADCPENTICLKQYGLCAVPAHRIPTEFGKPKGWTPKGDWQPPQGDPWWQTSAAAVWSAVKLGGKKPMPEPTPEPELVCPLDDQTVCQTNGQCSFSEDGICTRFTAGGRETCSTSASACTTATGGDECQCDKPYCFVPPTGAQDCVPSSTPAPAPPAPPMPWPDMPNNLGPLSCGPESTIGYPCVAHPRKGKCGIGICMAPPEGNSLTENCVSVCRDLREYPCGCECGDAWLKSCASVAGHIYDDQNNNGQNDGAEGGVAGAEVQLFVRGDSGYEFYAMTQTKAGGHYAFGGIPAGQYKVVVTLPGGLGFGGDGKSSRKVTVECLEDLDGDGQLRKRSLPTQVTIQRKFKANHLAEDVDFFAVPQPSNGNGNGNVGMDDDDDQDDDQDDEDDDDDDDDDTGSGMSSSENGGLGGGAIAAIILGAMFLVVICIVVLIFAMGRSTNRRTLSSGARAGRRSSKSRY